MITIISSFVFIFLSQAKALEPHEQLSDPVLEKRAVSLGAKILCPSCAGQTLNDSVAEEAALMRRQVRRYVSQGRTEKEIMTLFSTRYGEQVLLEPAWGVKTYWLWGLPWAGFVGLILMWLVRWYRQKRILPPH